MEQQEVTHRLRGKRYKRIICLFVILLIVLCYFIPRSFASVTRLNKLSINDIKYIEIHIMNHFTTSKTETYTITDEHEMNQIVDLFQKTKIRKKIIDVESVSEGYRGYNVSFVTKEAKDLKDLPFIHLFTDEIVSVNGKQYILYDTSFYDQLDTLLGIKTP